MKWTGGRATSGGERWTHTRGKQKHSFSSAYRTFSIPTHTLAISVRDWNHLTDRDLSPLPFSFQPLSVPTDWAPSPCTHPPLPLPPTSLHPSHLTILSQLVRELLVLFCQSQLEAPVSSNHQEPGRLQEGEGEEGGPISIPNSR